MESKKLDYDFSREECYVYQCICLKLFAELAGFICICILCGLSSKNPFESHKILNVSYYFYESSNITTNDNITLNNNVSIESNLSIISEYNALEKNMKKRKLISESTCSEIRDNFIKYKDSPLSNIFYLNYGKIRKISLANLIISCAIIVFIVVSSLFDKIKLKPIKIISKILIVLSFFLIMARFVLGIILIYYFEKKSDIEKYDEFLECKNIKVKMFEKFSDVNKIRKCSYAFFILNIISLGIDKLESLGNCSKTIVEERAKRTSKQQKYNNNTSSASSSDINS